MFYKYICATDQLTDILKNTSEKLLYTDEEIIFLIISDNFY